MVSFALFITALVTGWLLMAWGCRHPRPGPALLFMKLRWWLLIALVAAYLIGFILILISLWSDDPDLGTYAQLDYLLARFFHPHAVAIFWGLVSGAACGIVTYRWKIMASHRRDRLRHTLLSIVKAHPWPSLASLILLPLIPVLMWLAASGGLRTLESSFLSLEFSERQDGVSAQVKATTEKARRKLYTSFSYTYQRAEALTKRISDDIQLCVTREHLPLRDPRLCSNETTTLNAPWVKASHCATMERGGQFLKDDVLPLLKHAGMLDSELKLSSHRIEDLMQPFFVGYVTLARYALGTYTPSSKKNSENSKNSGKTLAEQAIDEFCDGQRTSAELLSGEFGRYGYQDAAKTVKAATQTYLCSMPRSPSTGTTTAFVRYQQPARPDHDALIDGIFNGGPHAWSILGGLALLMDQKRLGIDLIERSPWVEEKDFVDWNLTRTLASLYYYGFAYRAPVETYERYRSTLESTNRLSQRLECDALNSLDPVTCRPKLCSRLATVTHITTLDAAFVLSQHFDELNSHDSGRKWATRDNINVTVDRARLALDELIKHLGPDAGYQLSGRTNLGVTLYQAAILERRHERKLGLLMDAKALFKRTIDDTRDDEQYALQEEEAARYLRLTVDRLARLTGTIR